MTTAISLKKSVIDYATALRIKRVEAIPVALPLEKPMLMSGVRIESAENLVVRIEAENGATGWGEAASAPTMTGDLQAGMVAAVREHLAPLLEGQSVFEHARLENLCAHALHGNGGAKAATSAALLDLLGKHVQLPVCDLLGGAVRKTVKPMWLLGNKTVDEDITEASEKVREGFRFFKIKVGVKAVVEEIAATNKLRQALGPDVALCADANMGYDGPTALQYATGAADAGLLYFEQPLRDHDIAGMAKLARVSPIPLCADEPIASIKDIYDYHQAGAAGGINLKTIKLGGLAAVVQAGHVCQSLGLAINLACKVAESSIGAAALLQLGGVLGNLDWGVSVTNQYLAIDVVKNSVRLRGDGLIEIPRRPGLGIEIDEEQISRFRKRYHCDCV